MQQNNSTTRLWRGLGPILGSKNTMGYARYRTLFHNEAPNKLYDESLLKDNVGYMLEDQMNEGIIKMINSIDSRKLSQHYSCFIGFSRKAHNQMPHICFNKRPEADKLTAAVLPYQVYVPATTKGINIDVFPGTFVYCKEIIEDTRGKVDVSIGEIG